MAEFSELSPLICSSDDGALAERLKRRDPDAVELLYARFGRVLYGLVLNVVGEPQSAEDALSAIFVKAMNLAATLPDGPVCLGAWLLILARDHALQHKRMAGSRSLALEDNGLELPGLFTREADSPIGIEAVSSMREKFLRLSEEQRRALELAWYEDLTFPQMAARLGQPAEAVRAEVMAALTALRAQ